MHPVDRLVHEIGAHFEPRTLEELHLQSVAFSNDGLEISAKPSQAMGWALSGNRGFFTLPKTLPALADIRVALLALIGVSRQFQVPCVLTCADLAQFHLRGDTPEALHCQIRDLDGSVFDPQLRSELRLISAPLTRCLSAHGRLDLAAEVGSDPDTWRFMDSSHFTSYTACRKKLL
jgi:hypothetical protein